MPLPEHYINGEQVPRWLQSTCLVGLWTIALPLHKGSSSSSSHWRARRRSSQQQQQHPQHPLPVACTSCFHQPTGSARMHSSFLLATFVMLLAGTDARQPRSHSGRPHRHPHCFHANELQNGEVPPMFRGRVARWRRHTALPMASSLESQPTSSRRQRRHQEPTCADLKHQDLLNKDISERSISPWKYNIDEDTNRYPTQLAFAECLCKGCIDLRSGQETGSLNSVPVNQSVMVLRRKACQREDDTLGFSFEVEYIMMPVACTCALPQFSS